MTSEETLWRLVKAGRHVFAIARHIPGVGVELRFLWDDEVRDTRVFRSSIALAEAASRKREELRADGWVEQAPRT